MSRSTLLIVIALFLAIGGAVLVAQNNATTTSVSTEDGTRVEAPGTRVETNSEGTRVQAPGVDITVPKSKDGD